MDSKFSSEFSVVCVGVIKIFGITFFGLFSLFSEVRAYSLRVNILFMNCSGSLNAMFFLCVIKKYDFHFIAFNVRNSFGTHSGKLKL